ncbi:PadR family transcriptional regulator [Myceligenerans xiligouense]|uniref:PadR family transcriptional regulator n=1 Tax=Myceligenerans xiligouense TaxID=253184 RepID=A0A3N4Z771_9MICO|nr:PadR family transcriptional regulator [Myceligenerans xiligouense]RPF21152.1 PadR family transcriptional regulator [Myceligenerans xiligouense]
MILARIILGLLDLAPMSGYDLKRHFDTTINHFWTADRAQIYRTLGRLVEDGLVTVETVAGAKAPDKHEHRITEQGRATLREWLGSDLDRQPERDAFLARLFFAGSLDDAELGDLLARHRAATREQLDALEAIRAAAPPPADRRARLRIATLHCGLARGRAELAWLDEITKELT